MRANQVPSVDMLHSVGALMDTSFLRAAVADATETPRNLAAPVARAHSRAYEWLRRVFGRLAGDAR